MFNTFEDDRPRFEDPEVREDEIKKVDLSFFLLPHFHGFLFRYSTYHIIITSERAIISYKKDLLSGFGKVN